MTTSARFSGGRLAVPAKMTSPIFSPRRLLALCSPSAQRIASVMLLLPLPLGPTMPVSPETNSMVVLSAKDLKPLMVSCFNCIG